MLDRADPATTDAIIKTLPVHDLFIDLTNPTYTWADLWSYRSLQPKTSMAAPGGWWLIALDAWNKLQAMAFGNRIALDTLDSRLSAL